uniref:Uncharacterized protein n=1 Tax=Lotus japonicus TaxID=34305 RepID=I3SG97_LOTJA|nr:unknown [Lotus japonicus]
MLSCYQVHRKQSSETGKAKNMRKLKTLTPNDIKYRLKVQSFCAERISKMPTNPENPARTLCWQISSLTVNSASPCIMILFIHPTLEGYIGGLGCADQVTRV